MFLLSRRKKRESIEPNITPLIDIVFLLLIFFIVTSVFKSDDLKLMVKLPKSIEGASVKKNKNENKIVLRIKSNNIEYNDRVYSDFSLLERDLSKKNKDSIIEIRGDKESSYGFFIGLFDLLKKNNFRNINLITKKKVINNE